MKYNSLFIIFSMILCLSLVSASTIDWGDSLLSYWNLNEGTGSLATDTLGISNGTLNGNYNWSSGLINNSVRFQSASQITNMNVTPGNTLYSFNAINFSMQLWVKPDKLPADGIISNLVDKISGVNDGYEMYLYNQSGSQQIRFLTGNSNLILITNLSLPIGNWTHLFITRNGTGAYMFINGTLNASHLTSNTPSATGTSVLTFAARSAVGDNRNFSGYLDEIAMWNRSMSASDISILYNSGAGLAYGAGITENYMNFSNSTYPLSTENFAINITYFSPYYTGITGVLVYNNTRYSATSSGSGSTLLFSRSITIPNTNAAVNKSFHWEITLSNGLGTTSYNSSFANQSINPTIIDNCSASTVLVLNYTLRDEDDQTILTNSSNLSIQIQATFSSTTDSSSTFTFNKSYSGLNPAQVCISQGVLNTTNYVVSTITKYSSASREVEYHNMQNVTLNLTTIPQNINLYDLLSSESQEFLITFKDENFLVVPGVLIDITRQYIPEGIFKSVEIPKTDTDGHAIGHFYLSNPTYTIIVTKNGQVLGTYTNIVPFCNNQAIGDCKLNLVAARSNLNPTDFNTYQGLNYYFIFNATTRTWNAIFTTNDGGSTTMILNVTRSDNFGTNQVCSTTLTSSSGTLSCQVPSGLGNLTTLATLYRGQEEIASTTYTIQQSPGDTFGGARVLLVMILFITLPLLALSSGTITVILAMIGLTVAAFLNLFVKGAGPIGIGVTILWFVVAGGILVWKMSQRER